MNYGDTITVFRPVGDEYAISSPFGVTRTLKHLDGSTETHIHHGIDFAVPVGTSIYAMADGPVRVTGWENIVDHKQGLGYRIWQTIMVNGEKVWAWYGHLSKILVDPSDTVKQGQLIGASGFNGDATAPHLHVQFKDVETGNWLNATFPGTGRVA